MRGKLKTIEKFLGTRKLKGRPCYKMTSKKETISYMFINLIGNIQEYNVGKCHMTNVTYHNHVSGCHSITSYDRVI